MEGKDALEVVCGSEIYEINQEDQFRRDFELVSQLGGTAVSMMANIFE